MWLAPACGTPSAAPQNETGVMKSRWKWMIQPLVWSWEIQSPVRILWFTGYLWVFKFGNVRTTPWGVLLGTQVVSLYQVVSSCIKLYQVMNSYDEHVCNDSKDKRTLIKHEPFLHISTDYRVGLAIYYTETRSEPTCVTAWPNDTVILMCFVGTH